MNDILWLLAAPAAVFLVGAYLLKRHIDKKKQEDEHLADRKRAWYKAMHDYEKEARLFPHRVKVEKKDEDA